MSETTTEAPGMSGAAEDTHADQTEAATATADTTETHDQTTEATDDTDQATDPPQPDDPKRKPWWEKRIAESAFDAREANRKVAEMAAKLAQYEQGTQPAPSAQTPPPGYVPATAVNDMATQMLAERQFAAACNDVFEAGQTAHKDFDQAVRTVNMVAGPNGAPREFLEAVTALGKEESVRVLYDLGKNPDEAARVLALAPAKMGIELYRIANKPRPAVAAPSKAPPPIETVTGQRSGGNGEPDADKNPKAWTEWYRKGMASRR